MELIFDPTQARMTPYNPIAWSLESFQLQTSAHWGVTIPRPPNSMETQAPALRTLPAGHSYSPLPVILGHQSLTDPLEFQLFLRKNLLLDFLCGVFPVFSSLSLSCFVPCTPRKSCFFFFSNALRIKSSFRCLYYFLWLLLFTQFCFLDMSYFNVSSLMYSQRCFQVLDQVS